MRATLKDIKGFNVFFPSNRFVLFDKNGNKINAFELSKMSNVLDLNVLETNKTFVSFPTLHIKLDIEDKNLLCGWSNLKFGQSQIEWGN